MSLTYSNPRDAASFDNWPFGRTAKTLCTFAIETHGARGQRAVRTIIDPKTGKACAPKTLTYAQRATIVDGSDGKTYILTRSSYGWITVFQSNMQFNEEHIAAHEPRFAEINALFTKGQA